MPSSIEDLIPENEMYERKAIRSPSLRLRFGRTNPSTLNEFDNIKKRTWMGEINQKPIRSPSLRLRFGRRSDPSMELISKIESILNDKQQFSREQRKPSTRLRFGRSVQSVSIFIYEILYIDL